VGNEFSFRTFRQNVINGLSRSDLITGKLIMIFTIAVYAFIMVLLAILIFGIIFSNGITMDIIFEKSYLILIYFIQAIGYMAIGMLTALVFRNNALSIIMFLLYFAIIEPVVRLMFKAEARRFFPAKIISNLTPTPEFLTMASEKSFTTSSGKSSLDFQEIGLMPESLSLGLTVILATGYIGFFIGLAYLITHKRNL
jgi:ABC-type transport system involved in multi-copper enzyme maturation permease subunit